MKSLITGAFAAFLVFLAFSFGAASMDITTWAAGARSGCTYLMFCCFAIIVLFNITKGE